jgi:hypothetical protein
LLFFFHECRLVLLLVRVSAAHQVHIFDPTLALATAQRLSATPGVHFHPWGLAAGGPLHPQAAQEARALAEAGAAQAAYDDKVPLNGRRASCWFG